MFRKKIAVIGDIMLDHYVSGKCNRLSPEAPIPVVLVNEEKYILGGAGNVVRNLISYGCDVSLLTVTGKDEASEKILELLKKNNISNKSIITSSSVKTIVKSRIMVDRHQIVRIDKEKVEDISSKLQSKIINKFKSLVSNIDIVIISDYAKGVLTKEVLHSIISICKKNIIKVLVDPKGIEFSKYKDSYLLTPNKKEASLATGIDISDKKSLKLALNKLKKITNSNQQIITLGSEGIAFVEKNDFHVLPALAKDVYDITGAGDTVIASLAFKLSQGSSLYDSILFANKAASLVIQKIGSSVTTLDKIENINNDNNFENKVYTNSQKFLNYFNKIRLNKKVVFTNGCFDLLHSGHVKYLNEASKLGDILVLGLNSDESIKKIKGPTRPINNNHERAQIISAYSFVDYVIFFDDLNPKKLISLIKPDILVKGGDYSKDDVIGNEIVPETRILSFVEGKSTTEIIKKIKKDN